MKAIVLYPKRKSIVLHALVLLSITITLSLIISVFNWDTFTIKSFGVYFLQAASSIFLLLVPPIYYNIYWLIPRYLVKKRYAIYAILVLVLVFGWGFILGVGEPWMDEHWFNKFDQETSVGGGIAGMIFIMLITTLLNLSYRWFIQLSKLKQVENDRLNLELSALKNQINPHFFFNTLNNLYALSLEKSDETPSVILKLSEMMRYTIYDCKAEKVAIGGEITYLENFIALQKMRHHNRGHITFKNLIDDLSVQVAPMILIVFLENAFKHGFDLMEKNAFINMELKISNKTLVLYIENNFSGSENENQSGIGLENVKRRLSLIYPEAYTLSILNNKNVFKVQLNLNLE